MTRKRISTTRRIPFAFVVLLFGLGQGTAASADYSVQIAALRNPNDSLRESAERFGPVRTVSTSDGFTLYQVGPFEDRRAAEGALERLHSAGYADAFLRRVVDLPSVAAPPPGQPSAQARPSEKGSRVDRAMRDEALLASLPSEAQARAVYLDGVLHVKEGDLFVPASEYRR